MRCTLPDYNWSYIQVPFRKFPSQIISHSTLFSHFISRCSPRCLAHGSWEGSVQEQKRSQILLHIQSWKGLFWCMWFCPPLYGVWIREMLGTTMLPWIELWPSLPTLSYFSCRIIIIFQGWANILAEQEDWWLTASRWQTRHSYPRPGKNNQTHGANIETPWLWP